MYLEIWYDIVRQTHTQRGDARRKTKRVMWIKRKLFFFCSCKNRKKFSKIHSPILGA